MTIAVGIALLNIGAIIGCWGVIWRMWDKRATDAGIFTVAGIIAMLIGDMLT